MRVFGLAVQMSTSHTRASGFSIYLRPSNSGFLPFQILGDSGNGSSNFISATHVRHLDWIPAWLVWP